MVSTEPDPEPLSATNMPAVFLAVDRALNVDHRQDDQPCACDECMSYGAEDNGADWYRIPPANRIVMRVLDGGDDRFAALVTAFRDHEAADAASEPTPSDHDAPCVGCGEPTRSRTDAGTPKHVGCPSEPAPEEHP